MEVHTEFPQRHVTTPGHFRQLGWFEGMKGGRRPNSMSIPLTAQVPYTTLKW